MKLFGAHLSRASALGSLTVASAALALTVAGGFTGSARAADTATTMETLLDRALIEDLLVDYYRGFSGDHKGFASFYTDDGVLDVNGIVAQGKQGIDQLYANLGGGGGTRRPGVFRMLLTNIRVSVNGTTAKADAIWTGIQDENVRTTPQFVEQGREHDELVKKDGHWYIKHRYITADAGLPASYDKTYKPRDPQ
jgi:ketosteroid isomerase-like protein